MPQRLQRVKSIRLDLVAAVRRAHLRRGIFIGPASADAADDKKSPPQTQSLQESEESESDAQADKAKKKDKSEEKIPQELTGSQEPQEVHEKLIDITEKAQDVLLKADTVFPFTLFPDTITLDREKLTVATRTFFRIAKIVSVPVISISSAEVDVGPFFGSLHMASKYFVQNKYSVNFLWRKDAVKIQRMLQGFIIAQEKNIDLTDIEKEDLVILLTDLGQGVSE